MRFGDLRRRVAHAEQRVAVRGDATLRELGRLRAVWRAGWTPLRIVVAGLTGGFLVGKLEPTGRLNGARWLQMIGAVSGLFTAAQVQDAAEDAERAADNTEPGASPAAAAFAAAVAAMQAARGGKQAQPDEPPAATAADAAPGPAADSAAAARPPRPAEAATDVSERG